MKHIALAFGFLAALFSGVASAQWQTSSLPYPPNTRFFYVSKTAGDNLNDGSSASPWKDLSYAYTAMATAVAATGNPYAPAALIVEPGYYAPSNGETFPIRMRALKFISGMDAHTTIVSVEDASSEAFTFFGRSNPLLPANPLNGPFRREEGPYLERLTLRNSLATDASNITPTTGRSGIYMYGESWDPTTGTYVGDCDITQPTVAQLVVYGFNSGIRAQYAQPRVTDCTIVLNEYGLVTGGAPCCPDWEVINCVVNGNTITDLVEIDAAGVQSTNFTSATVGGTCGVDVGDVPVPGAGSNLDFPFADLAFVNSQPTFYAPQNLDPEFDFRLRANSPLRRAGHWTWASDPKRPLWDGEGFANLRLELANTGPSDIGADQFNSFRLEPLIRIFDHASSTIRSIAVGGPLTASQTTIINMYVTPMFATSSAVLAYPLIQDPALSTSYLPIPLVDPLAFDGILAISPIVLDATAVASGVHFSDTVVSLYTPPGLPLIMQVAFVDVLPSGVVEVSLSNGQRIQAHP
jgi:hypothetical protein